MTFNVFAFFSSLSQIALCILALTLDSQFAEHIFGVLTAYEVLAIC